MTLSVEQAKQIIRDWYESVTDYENALDERYLEELNQGVYVDKAKVRARIATRSLKDDVLIKKLAIEDALIEAQAQGFESKIINQLSEQILQQGDLLDDYEEEIRNLSKAQGVPNEPQAK